MRILPEDFQAHLNSGATTICNCWRLVRSNGEISGFTDHDRSIAFDGTTFEASSGFDGTHVESQIGFAVGGSEVSGVLQSDTLSESDLLNGIYDNARVELWRVNWTDPAQRVLFDVTTLGEVRRGARAFTAELRSLAHWFDQERGRVYQADCSADLGDSRCAVNLDDPRFRQSCTVTEIVSPLRIKVDLQGFDAGWFSAGTLKYVDGENAGVWQSVESFADGPGYSFVKLWTAPGSPIAIGTSIELTAGCNKRFSTCASKFANIENFRGFPHMPGNDALLSHPGTSNGPMDGESLYSR